MVLHVSLEVPHLREAVNRVLVGHRAIRQRTHSLHSDSDGVEGHAKGSTTGDCNSSSPEPIDPGWSKEEVGVLFAPIVGVSHRRAEHGDTHTVGKSTTHENTLISGTHQAVENATIVASALLWVQLVDLHTSEDQVNRVSHQTCKEATTHASHNVVVDTSSTSGIRVQLVIEEKEAPDSSSSVSHCLGQEAVPTCHHV